jgi:hypothetical protein
MVDVGVEVGDGEVLIVVKTDYRYRGRRLFLRLLVGIEEGLREDGLRVAMLGRGCDSLMAGQHTL